MNTSITSPTRTPTATPPSGAPPTALEVEDISHAYHGRAILRDISFSLPRAQVAALLGPSGCGKTTLLRLVAGLEPLREGRIVLFGDPVADAARGLATPPEARRVGMVFQDSALFPHLSVLDNVLFGVNARDERRRQWAMDMLSRFGLAQRADAWPSTLSGGERQRVALLRALAPRPRLLLLDEPFSSLDAARRLEMREETLALLRETNTTALMVTHDAQEAMFMADHIIVMHEGRIVQQGGPVDIYERPAAAFVMHLFGHVNRFATRVEGGGVARTPVGALPSPADLATGTPVEVFIRASAFRLAPEDEEGARREMSGWPRLRGEVLSAHFMGASSHLHVRPDGFGDTVVHVQLAGRVLPPPGSELRLAIDPAGIFVFPRRRHA